MALTNIPLPSLPNGVLHDRLLSLPSHPIMGDTRSVTAFQAPVKNFSHVWSINNHASPPPFLYLPSRYHPHAPVAACTPGLIIVGGFISDKSLYIRHKVIRQCSPHRWCYDGDYELSYSMPLSEQEWRTMQPEVFVILFSSPCDL